MKTNSRITIETPEHLEPQFRLAGIGARFIAFLVDKFIQLGAILGIFFFITLILYFSGQIAAFVEFLQETKKGLGQWLIALGLIFYGIIMIGYFIIFEYFWSGATPGKRFQSIRVIRKDGRPISFFDAAIRNILRLVDILAEVYPLGLIIMFFDGQNRRLGDLAAGTIVISERKVTSPVVLDGSQISPSLEPELREAVAGMTAEEYLVVSRFLSRRSELDPEHREQLASEIYKHLFKDSSQSLVSNPENLLEKLEKLYRERTRIF